MSYRAKYVKEITVIDPDSGGEVELAVYKHDNGGMFAIDSSWIEQVPEETEMMEVAIIDPFSDIDDPQTLYLEE